LNMAIEIVSFPIKNGGSFHSFLYVYQRVDFKWWLEYFNWDCLFVYLCLPLSEKLDVQQEFGELES